ncbi:MAG: hypothetical protein JST50_20465 [Bacteroidetes bacterium]|jgi:hypothetical protein|nr:hypothetical protein [Bacteroidota bacterium]
MNYFYLFLGAGSFIVLMIIIYDIQNRKKVNDILRANKNVPPLFMLRSAELKIAAIRSALNIPDYGDVETEQAKENLIKQLDKLVAGYKNREMPLTAYYAKLGSLLISVNKFRASVSGAPVQVHA